MLLHTPIRLSVVAASKHHHHLTTIFPSRARRCLRARAYAGPNFARLTFWRLVTDVQGREPLPTVITTTSSHIRFRKHEHHFQSKPRTRSVRDIAFKYMESTKKQMMSGLNSVTEVSSRLFIQCTLNGPGDRILQMRPTMRTQVVAEQEDHHIHDRSACMSSF